MYLNNTLIFISKCLIIFLISLMWVSIVLNMMYKNYPKYEFLDDHHRANKINGQVETFYDFHQKWQ